MESKEKNLSNSITDAINSMNFDNSLFNNAMSNEHRTLQQKFTGVCLSWLKHVSLENYQTDQRNQASHDKCKKIAEFMDLNGISERLPSI